MYGPVSALAALLLLSDTPTPHEPVPFQSVTVTLEHLNTLDPPPSLILTIEADGHVEFACDRWDIPNGVYHGALRPSDLAYIRLTLKRLIDIYSCQQPGWIGPDLTFTVYIKRPPLPPLSASNPLPHLVDTTESILAVVHQLALGIGFTTAWSSFTPRPPLGIIGTPTSPEVLHRLPLAWSRAALVP